MLSKEVLFDLWNSIRYLSQRGLNGDIIEFGVWRGGALELAAMALKCFGIKNKLIGVDTFAGHPEPNSNEIDAWGNNMKARHNEEVAKTGSWASANMEEVDLNLSKITKNYELIKEEVCTTTILNDVKKISILRLDMDWYEPTKAVLENFYYRIEMGGIVIIDDYGHHSGARDATDEFFSKNNISLNFRHLNYSCIAATIC